MITTLKPDHRIVHKPTAVIAATLLVALCGQAFAQDADSVLFYNTSRIHWFAGIIYGRTVGHNVERTGLHHGSYWLNGDHRDAGQRRTRFPHEQRQRHEHTDCARWRPADSCDATMRSSASMIAQTVVSGRITQAEPITIINCCARAGTTDRACGVHRSPTTLALQPDFAIKTSAGNRQCQHPGIAARPNGP